MCLEISSGIGFWHRKKPIVQPDLQIQSVLRADPVNRAFYLTSGSRPSGLTAKVGCAAQLNHFAGRVFHHFIALDDISILEPHFASGTESEIFRWRRFHE